MICKILGFFVNKLTADDKSCLLNRDNLWEDIQMQLSRKQKNIFRVFFFLVFSKSRLSSEHFQKNDDPHTLCVFELTDSEKLC